MYLKQIIILIILSVKFKTYESERLDKISINGKWFVDESNRVVLLRGINAVRKSYPWIPNEKYVDMTNKTQLSYLSKWGFNVVRLGLMWSGLVPGKTIFIINLKPFINKSNLN